MNTVGVRQHVNQVVDDMGNLFRGCINTPLILTNLGAIIVLSIAAVTQFNQHNAKDLISFTDAAFIDSPALVSGTQMPATYVMDPETVALDESSCTVDDRLCRLSHVSPLTMSHSGLLSNEFFNLAEQSMRITHMIWVVSWFTTPISLFLFANANWINFEKWMWWLLYMFIFAWNSVGLILMLFEQSTPMYNGVFAILYFIFSSMLIFSVREAWQVVTNDGSEKFQTFTGSAARLTDKVPKLMQVPLTKVKPAYFQAESSEAQTIPTEIRYIFSQTALVVTEFFFIIPILYLVATVMVQYRVTPFDLQVRYWLSTIFYGSLILMEKSRRVGVTYMTDVCLISFSISTAIALGYFHVFDLMTLSQREVSWPIMWMYIILIFAHLIGILIIVSNIVLAAIMNKGAATMTDTEEKGTSTDIKMLQYAEKLTFRSTLVVLIGTKIILSRYLLDGLITVA